MFTYAMLYAVAVGAAFLLGAAAVAAMLRSHGRAERGVWLGALALTLIVPVVALVAGPREVASPAVVGAVDIGPVVGAFPSVEVSVIPVDAPPFDLDGPLLLIWLLVSAGLALHWMISALRLAHASRSWHPGTIDGVQTWLTEDLGPAVSGTFRPRVLAPRWLPTMPEASRTLILRHELEHIRAKDPLLVSFARVARILTPWNPTVWALGSRLQRAIELDCDRRVLRRAPNVAAYAETLLAVSARRPPGLVAAAAFAESEASFRSRILALTTPARRMSVASLATSTVVGALLMIAMLRIPVPEIDLALNDRDTESSPALQQSSNVRTPNSAAGDASAWTPPSEFLTASQVTFVNKEEMDAAFFAVVSRIRSGVVLTGDVVTGPPTGWQMSVWLNVGASGRVIDVRTSDAWGLSAADQRELAALYLRVVFEPVTRAGEPTPFWLRIDTGAYPAAAMARPADDSRGATRAASSDVQVAQATVQQVPGQDYPRFTPMSIRPQLLNGAELAPALSAVVPAETRAAGIQMSAILWLYIGTDGFVQRAVVQESSGSDAFDGGVREIAFRMRFGPAQNRNQPVPVWVQVPMTFRPRATANQPPA